MKNLFNILFCCLLVHGVANAQSLDVFNIDTSGFPTIKAKFYAFDQDGKQLPNLSPSDFSLTENGISRTVTKISCPPIRPPEKVSITMSIDISGSMSYGNGSTDIPVELGKTTAANIVNVFPLPPNEIALQTCHDKSFVNLDLTTNRQRLLEAIEPVTAGGGNDFVEHLLNPETGLLNVAKKGKYKRVAILYTDAWWHALTPTQLQRCKDTCAKYNIKFFAAIYSRPESEPNGIKLSLEELAKVTGGKFYDGIISKEEALNLAKELKTVIDYSEPCNIEWISDVHCNTTRLVSLAIPARVLQSEESYNAPMGANTSIKVKPAKIIDFGSIAPGTYKDTTFTIVAENTSVEITKITPSLPSIMVLDYGGTAPPFIIPKGSQRVVTIRYQPNDGTRIYGKFIIENNQCKTLYSYVSGGDRNKSSQGAQQFRLTHPNGSEVFLANSDTTITWEGVPTETSVKLEYSLDKGKIWNKITNEATGLQYRWKVPNTVSDQCLIKASAIGEDNNNGNWSRKIIGGEVFNENITSMITDNFGNVYISGYVQATTEYVNQFDFGDGLKITTTNTLSLFLAKFNAEGQVLWAKAIASDNTPANFDYEKTNICAIKTDESGQIYMAGSFTTNLRFSQKVVVSSLDNYSHVPDLFIAKYSQEGEPLWAKAIGSESGDAALSMTIGTDENIYIAGYSDSPSIGTEDGKTMITAEKFNKVGSFLIKLDSEANLIWGKSLGLYSENSVLSLANDNINDIYLCGNFSMSGQIDLGNGIQLTHSGENGHPNTFLIKYNTDGNIMWGKKAGNATSASAKKVAVDYFGGVYVWGEGRSSTMDFDGETTLSFQPSNLAQNYLAKYDAEGRFQWAKNSPYIHAMATDPNGYVITYGTFRGSIEIEKDLILKSYSDDRFACFVAKYSDDGTLLLVKKISYNKINTTSTIGDVTGGVLHTDSDGNIYIQGKYPPIDNFVDFENGTTIEHDTNPEKYWRVFFAKYTSSTLIEQADTSDAVFSIVKPVASSHNIDMGRVLVASSKDSLLQSFITNTGSLPIRIDAINIAGTNAADFQLVSGIPPYTIPVGGVKSVEFRFKPSAVGTRSAELSISTQADILRQSITGEGIKPVLNVSTSLIDFGIKEIGTMKDTMVTAVLENTGNLPLSVSQTQMLGPDKEQFEILSGGGNFTLEVGGIHQMQLRFSPRYSGRTSGQIGFDYNGMPEGRPAIVQLFGQGIGGNVYIVDDSAYIGETRDIKLMLGKVKTGSTAQTTATSFHAKITYSNAILFPVSSSLLKDVVVRKGIEFDTLSITHQWNSTNTELARIPLVATLGNWLSTGIDLVEFDWLNDRGEKIDYDTELQSGTFTVLGICPEGGLRLFEAEGTAQMMMVMPHPVSSSGEVRFSTVEKGVTIITLTDVLGRQIVLTNKEFAPGEYTLQLETDGLTTGIYILTMQTPTQVFTKQVIIEK